MNGLVDYHLHSHFSPDGQEDILAICQKAQDLGLAEICLTDHADFDPHDWGYGNYKYETLQAQIAQVRARFDQNSLRIGFGVEVSYEARHEDEIRQFLDGKEFDLVLGSVHRAGGLSLEGELYEGRPEEEAVGLYFGELQEGIKSELFDVMAHFDLIKRYSIAHYGRLSFAKYHHYYEEGLRAMVEKRKPVWKNK